MVSKKYLKDFEIVYDEAPNGKLKARAVYKGMLYAFVDTGESMRKAAREFTLYSAAGWIAYLAPLFFLSAAARTFYVIVPHTLAFLPLVFMSAVTIDLWTVKPPLIREKRDHISERGPRAALFMLLLSGAGAAGFIVSLFLNRNAALPGDLIFGLCEAVLLAASCLLFKNRKRTATKETTMY